MGSRNLLSLLILTITTVVIARKCPTRYLRFTPQHSACLDPNPTCSMYSTGVDEAAKEVILRVHNELRSKVATGKENRAGGLPTASNMLELEWDNELSIVAQRWAQQCLFDHDCGECRSVENFSVGQNLAYEDEPPCSTNDCIQKVVQPDWTKVIKMFYEEVTLFDKSLMNPFQFQKGYGHFSQVVWANSWKIGCGYVVFKHGGDIRRLYACNYGPAGNSKQAMYEAGSPASACPKNTAKSTTYDGLCKVQDSSVGPAVSETKKDTIMECNWRGEACQVSSGDKATWYLKPSLSGSYITTKLNGGDKRILNLVSHVKPNSKNFCLVVIYRKGPADASNADSSNLAVDLNIPSWNWKTSMKLQSNTKDFIPFKLDLGWDGETEVGINISLPPGAPEHIFDLKDVYAYDGKC